MACQIPPGCTSHYNISNKVNGKSKKVDNARIKVNVEIKTNKLLIQFVLIQRKKEKYDEEQKKPVQGESVSVSLQKKLTGNARVCQHFLLRKYCVLCSWNSVCLCVNNTR